MTDLQGTLVERAAELQALTRAAAEAETGKARLVLLTGEAGIGKTALWSGFADQLPKEWQFDYVGAHHTDRSFAAPFEHLAGELVDADDSARALADAVAKACIRRAESGPLLLVVEDLHFVDPVAVTALPHLLNRLRRQPVLLIATYRLGSHPVGAAHTRAVADVLRHPGAFELRVSSLSPDGVSELMNRLTGSDDATRAERLHVQTNGNPFFIEALVQASDDAGSVPWTVAEAVVALLETVPDDARELAELLAAAGKPLAPGVLGALMEQWAGPAVCLCESGLAYELAGDQLALRHALVAETLTQQVGGSRIASRHRQLAEALDRSGEGDDESLARHWSSAGERALAAPHAARAASVLAARGAHARASELYDIALSEAHAAGLDKATLFERSALAAAGAGRIDRARTLGQLAEQARDAEGHEWQAGGNWVNTALMREVETVGSEEGAESSVDDEALNAIMRAQEAINMADMTRARDLAETAARLALEAGDDATASTAALAFCYSGDIEKADAILSEITGAAVKREDWLTVSVVSSRWSRVTYIAGDYATAVERNLDALEAGKKASGPELWGHLSLGTAFLEANAGHLTPAQQLCDQVIAADQPILTEYAKAALTVIAIELGEIEESKRHLDVLLPIVRALGIGYYWLPVLTMLSRMHILEGNTEAALEFVAEADAVRWSPYNDFATDLLLVRAVAAHLDGDPGSLAEAEHGLTRLYDALGGPVNRGAVSFTRALRVSSLNVGEAVEAFEAAARSWSEAPRWAWAAEAWCEAAIAAHVGDPDAATEYLARAREITDQRQLRRVAWRVATISDLIGADAPVSRAARPATARKASRRAPTPTLPDDPVAAETGEPEHDLLGKLTAREREIVTRVAAGRTNREVADELELSDKTVRNYLSNVFTKLGVSRRAELVALLRGPEATDAE